MSQRQYVRIRIQIYTGSGVYELSEMKVSAYPRMGDRKIKQTYRKFKNIIFSRFEFVD